MLSFLRVFIYAPLGGAPKSFSEKEFKAGAGVDDVLEFSPEEQIHHKYIWEGTIFFFPYVIKS